MEIEIINNVEKLKRVKTKSAVSVFVTGDFCATKGVADLVKNHEFDKLFNDFSPFLQAADICITNLESPLTESELPIVKTGPALKGPQKTVEALKYAGINLVSLANNHIMDYGRKGLEDTLNALRSENIQHMGAGMTLEDAKKPIIIEKKEKKIALINITEREFSIATDNYPGAAPLDEVANFYQIKEANEIADVTILIIHGGNEMYSLPSPKMVQTYRFFADLDVDVIIGHHSHIYSGYEIYHGVPIIYGIGNFLFDTRLKKTELWFKGYAVNIILEQGIKLIQLIPYIQFMEQSGVRKLKDTEIPEFKNRIDGYNEIIKDTEQLEKRFSVFSEDSRPYYLSVLLGLNRVMKKMIRHNLFTKIILNRKKLVDKLNLIECQAHREVIIEILKSEIRKK